MATRCPTTPLSSPSRRLPPAIKSGSYLLNSLNGMPATLGVYQQLSTRAGGEVDQRRLVLIVATSGRLARIDRTIRSIIACLAIPSGTSPEGIGSILNATRSFDVQVLRSLRVILCLGVLDRLRRRCA